ncbi:uncharacterized protein [Mytilus edulis]|uniref:uncharacterized protein n=1 Tax=Mytilus edulis TaxID=6550 RepID=UPI0039EEE120
MYSGLCFREKTETETTENCAVVPKDHLDQYADQTSQLLLSGHTTGFTGTSGEEAKQAFLKQAAIQQEIKRKYLFTEKTETETTQRFRQAKRAYSMYSGLCFRESCSPGYLCQGRHGYRDRQKPSTTEEDADTFDKHKNKCIHWEQLVCDLFSLLMELLSTLIEIFQGSIKPLNLKTKNNDTLFSFGESCSQSINGVRYWLTNHQFCKFKRQPGFLTVLTQDWKVFRVRTFHTNYLSQTSVGLSMHLCNGEFRQSAVEDLCELVIS